MSFTISCQETSAISSHASLPTSVRCSSLVKVFIPGQGVHPWSRCTPQDIEPKGVGN